MKKILVTGFSILLLSLTFNVAQARDKSDHSSDILGPYWSKNKEFAEGLIHYGRDLGYITAVSEKDDCEKDAQNAKNILENTKAFVAKIEKALEIDSGDLDDLDLNRRAKGAWEYQYPMDMNDAKTEHCSYLPYKLYQKAASMEAFQSKYSSVLDEYIKNNSSASPKEDLK